jgi:hypothetical protein
MPQNPEALKALRRQTIWFIRDDPFDIVLVPRVKTSFPGGGYEMNDGPPRATQRVKLVYTGSARGVAGKEGIQITEDGAERRYDYVIIGPWNMVAEVGDHWVDARGQVCEITGMIPDNEYERRLTASIYGKRTEGG